MGFKPSYLISFLMFNCLLHYLFIDFFSFGIFLKLKLSLMIKKLFIETLGTLYIQQLNFGDFGELH